jgi:predicted RNA-binding protein YlxR (DUF448 family)
MPNGEPAPGDDDLERTCIVTRKVCEPAELIRFVATPQGGVVADLKGRLPGRGAWVAANRRTVEQAVARRLFARALKREVTAPDELAIQVEAQLRQQALSALAIARKAGSLAQGFDQVEAALRSGKARAWISAADAAEDGIRKLRNAAAAAATGQPVEFVQAFGSGEIGSVFGRDALMHVAFLEGGAGEMALASIRKWKNFDAG